MTTLPLRRPWLGLVVGPLAWITDELAAIALTSNRCAAGLHVGAWLPLMSLIGLAGIAVTAWAMVALWRAIGGEPVESGLGDLTQDRRRFMARFGFVVSGLCLFAIAMRTISVLFLGGTPC